MRSLMKCLALALVCALGAIAQTYDIYTVSYTVTLSGAQTALAVQLPSTGTNRTDVMQASVQCSAACPIRLEINGAAANSGNATAATVVALNPESTPASLVTTPKVEAWTGTGVPTGTAVSPIWTIPAQALVPFGGERVLVTQSGVNSNYIMRVAQNYTGEVKLFFSLRVRR